MRVDSIDYLDPMPPNTRLLTRHSVRALPGRQFEPLAEKDLLPDARNAIRELPNATAGVTAVVEMPAPRGVPDMTVIVGNPSARQARLRLDVAPLLNQIDAAIVASIWVDRPSTPRTVAKRLGWSLETVERRLPRLIRSGAVRITDSATLTRHRALAPIGTIYAIELKLTAWKRALTQGRTYRTWADSYILVMERIAKGAFDELTDAVTSDQAGLRVSGEWIVRPRTTPNHPAKRLWASEHIIAAWA